MRHLFVVGIASLTFFLLATIAYRYDVARYNDKITEDALRLSQELLRFELSYFQAAQPLLQLNGDKQLLEEIQSYESRRQTLTTREEQEALFQSYVTRVKARLLVSMEEGLSEPLAQEWRRATDQMQGSLTRRTQILSNK